MKNNILAIFTFIWFFYSGLSWGQPRDFTKNLFKLYENERHTFSCHTPFNEQGKVSWRPCKDCSPSIIQIKWMPIVPLWQLAAHKTCFQQKLCVNAQGKPYKGIACCLVYDNHFAQARFDLNNFVPEIAYFIQQRGRAIFDRVDPAGENQQLCHFTLNKKQKRIEPPDGLKGLIARTFLYMHYTYHFSFSEVQKNLYLHWHHQYPVTDWERKRNQKIKALQGASNFLVN